MFISNLDCITQGIRYHWETVVSGLLFGGGRLRFIISGAAGFIGSHMCDRLIGEGHSVVAVDSLMTGSTQNIEHLLGDPNFQFLEHDVCETFDVEDPIDGVLHLASLASPKDYLDHPIETLDVG